MGKFIHLFNTEAEYEAKRETGYTEPWVSYTRETSAVTYNKDEHEKLLKMPLTFEILSNGNITWSWYDDNEGEYTDANKTIYYKKNEGEWAEMPRTLSVVSGDAVQFKGDNARYGSDDGVAFRDSFSEATTAGFILKGNIMSLIDSTDFTTVTTLVSSYTFNHLFSECTGLTSAENLVLPATTLADYCYAKMFQYCTSLTSAPALPATTLADGCYENMFYGCTSLISAPTLPATTLAEACYDSMFFGCTSLTTAPALPATTLADYCYANMFRDCTNLTSAPELPATALTNYCYFYMFASCTNLNYIKCLATDISANSCKTGWVGGVSSTGTFVKNPGITENEWGRGNSGIPANWTVQDA